MTALRRRRLSTGLALVLTGLVTASCTMTPAASSTSRASEAGVPEAALAVMGQPEYANAHWLISVADLESGEVLIDLDSEMMTEPASFTKSYSMGAAWLTWGPDHTITTPVKRTGEVTGGVLSGDLVLVGKGDITLGGRTKADGTVDYTNLDHNDANPLPGATLTDEDPLAGLDDLAAQVKAAGVDTVTGDVVVDDRLFSGSLDGEPITPIVVNQNLIDVLVTPGAAGEPATIEMTPPVAPWRIAGAVQTVDAGGETDVADPAADSPGDITMGGTIAADSDPVLKVLVLEDPASFARTAFIEALQRAGVTVASDPIASNATAGLPAQDAVDALPSVAEFESLPLEEQATYVMKISYNRGAQTYVCLLAVEAGLDECGPGGAGPRAMAEVGRIWSDAGLDTEGASLIDGSGLVGNYITPANGVALQRILAERPDAERWKETMPILGVDGSLATVQPDSPAAGKVFAKTGTLLGGDSLNTRFRVNTKALGGVMETKSGRTLVFTVVMNQGFETDLTGVFQANDDVGAVVAAIQQAY